MKKIIILIISFFGVISAYAQTDSFLLKQYEQKILEISQLKNDLQKEKQNNSDLSDAYKKYVEASKKEIKELRNEVSSEKQKVSDLNKNKIKEERDYLQTKVESLNAVISKQYQTNKYKDSQILSEKAIAKTSADQAKKDGKAEILASVAKSYNVELFDDLIISSTKESVARDEQLLENDREVEPILNDLETYFKAKELLSAKFDAIQIKNAQTLLSQINRQSKLLDALKDDVEFYQAYNTALKITIGNLVNLDGRKSADGDSGIQKLKFNEIVIILTDYMYNYYDYAKYPSLSDIVSEIIKRKHLNADADIADLIINL